MRIRLHFNKFGEPRGLPWTLHTSKGCFPASHVDIRTGAQTEEKPDKKDNPRYFIRLEGSILWHGSDAMIVGEDSPAWVPCRCGNFQCTIHGCHVHECECPVIEEWDTDPYSSRPVKRRTMKIA